MRLWTWQKPDVSLVDGEYDNLTHSYYINDRSIAKSEREQFKKAYIKLWNRLGKKENEKIKIIYCYLEEKEAKDKTNKINENKILWEMDVPETQITYICSVAWHWILYGKDGVPYAPPDTIFQLCHSVTGISWKQFIKEFNEKWRNMSEDVLWDILLLENPVDSCSEALVIHPLERGWGNKKIQLQ
jgi:hypothetical protein